MIIFGTKSTRKLLGSGTFRCPQCQEETRYEKRRAKRWGHLFWIPIIPMEEQQPYVECRKCKCTFVPQVLDRNHDRALIKAEFERAAGLVMAKMILADGKVEEAEKASLRDVLGRITGGSVEIEFVDALVAKARQDQRSAADIAAVFASSLNASGAELVVKASLMIAVSDGDLADTEVKLLSEIARALGMSQAHYKGVMAEMLSAPADAPPPPAPTLN